MSTGEKRNTEIDNSSPEDGYGRIVLMGESGEFTDKSDNTESSVEDGNTFFGQVVKFLRELYEWFAR